MGQRFSVAACVVCKLGSAMDQRVCAAFRSPAPYDERIYVYVCVSSIPHLLRNADLETVQSGPAQSFAPAPFMASGMFGMGSAAFNQTPYAAQYNPVVDKGKGKSINVDFDAAFAEVTASLVTTRISTSRIVEVDDDTLLAEPPKQENGTDLDDLAKYEAEFQEWMDATREDGEYDYGTAMQAAWEGDMKLYPENGLKYDDAGIPDLGSYRFGAHCLLTGALACR
jgi:hypothetical protein